MSELRPLFTSPESLMDGGQDSSSGNISTETRTNIQRLFRDLRSNRLIFGGSSLTGAHEDSKKNELFHQGIPTVYHTAYSFHVQTHVDLDDLISVGMIHLWNIIDKFNPHRSENFIGFIHTVVKRHLTQYVAAWRGTIPYSVGYHEYLKKKWKIYSDAFSQGPGLIESAVQKHHFCVDSIMGGWFRYWKIDQDALLFGNLAHIHPVLDANDLSEDEQESRGLTLGAVLHESHQIPHKKEFDVVRKLKSISPDGGADRYRGPAVPTDFDSPAVHLEYAEVMTVMGLICDAILTGASSFSFEGHKFNMPSCFHEGEHRGRTRDVLLRRFGIDDTPIETLKEIGARHNITRSMVLVIQNKVTEGLRRVMAQVEAFKFPRARMQLSGHLLRKYLEPAHGDKSEKKSCASGPKKTRPEFLWDNDLYGNYITVEQFEAAKGILPKSVNCQGHVNPMLFLSYWWYKQVTGKSWGLIAHTRKIQHLPRLLFERERIWRKRGIFDKIKTLWSELPVKHFEVEDVSPVIPPQETGKNSAGNNHQGIFYIDEMEAIDESRGDQDFFQSLGLPREIGYYMTQTQYESLPPQL